MNVLIVAGGRVCMALLKDMVSKKSYYIIGVDGGLDRLLEAGITADAAVGDFDSASGLARKKYIGKAGTTLLNPEKDFTDMHVAVMMALKLTPEQITILGGTGSRIDHMLANIGLLALCRKQGVDAEMIDETNKIKIVDKCCTFRKQEQFGKYVSFIPFADPVKGVCLKGFKYGLDHVTVGKMESIGVSNEIREEEGSISMEDGYMIAIESKD
ncbi:MAG: thiamine diphosphokinase [Clostridium sp.]|nr:thiamine diphosphokinase [Clostridium sp.]MCM1398211.1 thiamine diphosphokinase [Clostridium sp.]MCM1460375.1 thiamine diphosphokinase [Bacteroides sp.]